MIKQQETRSGSGGSGREEADTRQRLVEAARELFWLKGYNSTSVAEILSAAGANSGSLYHYFPTKQDLLVEVLESYRTGIGPMLLEPAWEGIDDPLERVFALLGRYRQHLVETECFYGCPIGSLALELHEPDPPVRGKLVANFEAWTGAVEGCLREAKSDLPPGIDPRTLARFVLTTMEGGVMQARTHRSVEPYDDCVRVLRDYLGRPSGRTRDGRRS